MHATGEEQRQEQEVARGRALGGVEAPQPAAQQAARYRLSGEQGVAGEGNGLMGAARAGVTLGRASSVAMMTGRAVAGRTLAPCSDAMARMVISVAVSKPSPKRKL